MSETDVLLVRNAARGLIDAARRERASLDAHSDERTFLLGVDAAAMEVLHPELQATRGDGWLDREPALFREGYQRTVAMLAAARGAGAVPTTLRLPRLDESQPAP